MRANIRADGDNDIGAEMEKWRIMIIIL